MPDSASELVHGVISSFSSASLLFDHRFSILLRPPSAQVTVHATLLAGMLLATRRVLARSGDVGELVLVVAYVFTIFGPLAFLGSLYHMVVNATVDLRALGEILATEPSVRDKLGARDLDVAEKPGVPMIEFVGVGFAYGCQGAQVSLQDISFSVPHGGSVALVGPSGAGKTTLTRLLFRFYDADQGSVRLNGQDRPPSRQNGRLAVLGFGVGSGWIGDGSVL